MSRVLSRLFQDENGATAIEYGLIGALISVAIIVALQAVGAQLGAVFASIAANLAN